MTLLDVYMAFRMTPEIHIDVMSCSVVVPPEVVMTNKRIGHRLGRETILECSVYGNPQGLTFWKKNGRQIITDERFTVEAYEDIENRIVTLSLRINPLEKQDFGRYVCEGSNHLGMDREEMVLYGK